MAELRRLLISPERLGDATAPLALDPHERRYLERVLRLRPGARFAISDGAGRLYEASLQEQGMASIETLSQQFNAAQPQLVLLQGLMRRDLEITLRMATELGVDRIVPLKADRSVLTPREQRHERWRSQLREATEQCERLWRPELLAVKPADAWWSEPDAAAARALATTRHHTLPSLAAWLNQQQAVGSGQGPKEIWLAIGPEAGWSEDEVLAAGAQGWTTVQLGPSILRTATAAVAAATLMTSWRSMRNP